MSVENWARREAEQAIPAGRDREFMGDGVPHAERIRFADGIVHAFDALLSDEAIEAGSATFWDVFAAAVQGRPSNLAVGASNTAFRAALEAAVRAATEGGAK